MLDDQILVEAGMRLWCLAYADEVERRGFCFPARTELTKVVERLPQEVLIPIMRGYEKELAEAWTKPVEQVFQEMNLEESEYADALYCCLMACNGHGVGLEDDHQWYINQYQTATGQKLDTSPIHTDLIEFADLAMRSERYG